MLRVLRDPHVLVELTSCTGTEGYSTIARWHEVDAGIGNAGLTEMPVIYCSSVSVYASVNGLRREPTGRA